MTTNVMDPLKLRAMGVKKPLEDKKDKIESLQEDYKRYYPVDKNGQLDEWGAVIKRQTENYQREQADKAVQKTIMQQEYSKDLEAQLNAKRQN
jgi:hypothetical protein